MQLSMRTCPVSLLSMSSNSSQASAEALKQQIADAEVRILDIYLGVIIHYYAYVNGHGICVRNFCCLNTRIPIFADPTKESTCST